MLGPFRGWLHCVYPTESSVLVQVSLRSKVVESLMRGAMLSPCPIVLFSILAGVSSRSRSSGSYLHEPTDSMSMSDIVGCLWACTSFLGPFPVVAGRAPCLSPASSRLGRVDGAWRSCKARPATTGNGPREEVQAQRQPTMSDVDIESVGSCECDPDDLDLEETPARMANATMG